MGCTGSTTMSGTECNKPGQRIFLSHFKEEAASEVRNLKFWLSQEVAGKGLENVSIFLDSDNLHKINELLEEVRLTDHLVFLLTKNVLTRPWCLLELWTAHQNGVNIVPVQIESRGTARKFEFGPSADAFKNTLFSQVSKKCIEEVTMHGATVEEVQMAIAELLGCIATPFNIEASETVQKAQVHDIINRFIAAGPRGTRPAITHNEIRTQIIDQAETGEKRAVTPEVFHKHCEKGRAAEVAAALEAARGDYARLRALLEHRDSVTWTPLHDAARQGHGEVVRLLLEAGADRDARDNDGDTPMHVPTGEGYGEVVRLLLEAGADRDARNNDGETPMHKAAGEGYGEVVRLLLEAGADRDARGSDGWTPMHWAAARGHGEVVRLLLEAGADRDARDNDGQTPMHAAQNPPSWYNAEQKKGCAAVIGILS